MWLLRLFHAPTCKAYSRYLMLFRTSIVSGICMEIDAKIEQKRKNFAMREFLGNPIPIYRFTNHYQGNPLRPWPQNSAVFLGFLQPPTTFGNTGHSYSGIKEYYNISGAGEHSIHGTGGHCGVNKTLEQPWQQYFCYGMSLDVQVYITTCAECN